MQDAVITGFFGTPASGQAAEANGWNGAQGATGEKTSLRMPRP